jgi:Mg/Co/Ni transporter MgtE
MLNLMDAAEIIEEIQRLPEHEKGKLVEFMRHQPNAETIAAMEEAKHPEKLEKFDSAAEMFKKLGIEC